MSTEASAEVELRNEAARLGARIAELEREPLAHETTASVDQRRQLAESIQALRESESRLRALTDNLPEGAIYRYRHDAHGEPHIDFISAGIEGLTGVPAAEYVADHDTMYRLPRRAARMRRVSVSATPGSAFQPPNWSRSSTSFTR